MTPPARQSARCPPVNLRRRDFQLLPGLVGLWIALALLKFGQPVILDHQIAAPKSALELVYQSWPVAWGYGIFALVVITVLATHDWRSKRGKVAGVFAFVRSRSDFAWLLPPATCVAWLIWQALASWQTIGPPLTRATLPHYLVCGLSFFVGVFCFANSDDDRRLRPLWLGIAGGWLIVVAIGWRQHFGGLAETRDFFFSLPNWQEQSPELIAKVRSNRIYSTLVYPNALAGVVLLFSPVLILGAWDRCREQSVWVRAAVASLPAIGAAGCLVWSGSKAGWLLALALAVLGWVHLRRADILVCRFGRLSSRPAGLESPANRQARKPALRSSWAAARNSGALSTMILGAVVFLVLGGFWYRYSDYFSQGAKSVSARLDYWNVAWSNACARPFLGTGPGTFMLVYRHAKPPDAEMSRLVHNDYLQQATDSGFVGGLLFLGLVGSVVWTGIRNMGRHKRGLIWYGVWLGVLGMSAHSLVEFGLFIPALAWPWFVAMGALACPRR